MTEMEIQRQRRRLQRATRKRALVANATKCQWFLLCENEATTSRAHPILKAVPICERCDAKIAGLEQR
jgi:hypothetical protein